MLYHLVAGLSEKMPPQEEQRLADDTPHPEFWRGDPIPDDVDCVEMLCNGNDAPGTPYVQNELNRQLYLPVLLRLPSSLWGERLAYMHLPVPDDHDLPEEAAEPRIAPLEKVSRYLGDTC